MIQSFITQDSGDRDLLVRNLSSFDVPVLNYTGADSHRREPFQISEDVYFLEPFSFIVSEGILVCRPPPPPSYPSFVDSLSFLQMCTLGIYARLDEVFDAPMAVTEVLTGQCGLDHSVCILIIIAYKHKANMLVWIYWIRLYNLHNSSIIGNSVYRNQRNWSEGRYGPKIGHFWPLDSR